MAQARARPDGQLRPLAPLSPQRRTPLIYATEQGRGGVGLRTTIDNAAHPIFKLGKGGRTRKRDGPTGGCRYPQESGGNLGGGGEEVVYGGWMSW